MASPSELVAGLLEQDEPNFRAALGLGTEVLPLLRRVVESGDPVRTPKAVFLTGVVGGPGALAILELASVSPDTGVRAAAAAAAGRLGSVGNNLLMILAQDSHPAVRKFAVSSLSHPLPPDLRRRVAGLCRTEGDPVVKKLARRARRKGRLFRLLRRVAIVALVAGSLAALACYLWCDPGFRLIPESTQSSDTAAGSSFPPLRVRVEDRNGDPVAGVLVTFSVRSVSGRSDAWFAGRRSQEVRTDSRGVATSSELLSNEETGRFEVTATASGLEAVVFERIFEEPPIEEPR